MKHNKKIFLLSLLTIFLLLFSVNFVSAKSDLEVQYPIIGGTVITKETSLPDYIAYIFNLSIIIGTVIVIGSLIYGGFRYLTSVGNPGAMKDAQSQIYASFLGLIILFTAHMVLQMVNPQIIKLEMGEKPPVGIGITLTNTKGKTLHIGTSLTDASSTFPDFTDWGGSEEIEFQFDNKDKDGVNKIRAISYHQPGFKGEGVDLKYFKSPPEGPKSIAANALRSIEIKGYPPGIYLWKDEPGILGDKLYMNQSTEQFPVNWSSPKDYRHALMIDIKNGEREGEKVEFIAVLHEDTHYRGKLKIFTEGKAKRIELPPNNYGDVEIPSSAHVFELGEEENCIEVILHTEPGFKGDECVIKIKEGLGVLLPANIDLVCKGQGKGKFEENIRSIFIRGRCLVVLFDTLNGSGPHSEVFTDWQYNLSHNPINDCNHHWWDYLIPGTWPCAKRIAIFPLAGGAPGGF